MANSIQIRVDQALVDIMEETKKRVSGEIKATYGVNDIVIPGTFVSQIIAAQLSGKKVVKFKVNKVSRDKGIVELI